MKESLFAHQKNQVISEDLLFLLGTTQDGNYLIHSDTTGKKVSVARSNIRLQANAALALTNAAQCLYDATGAVMHFDSGFRSIEDQIRAFRSALIRSGDFSRTIARVAPPGYSEHHTGLAVDLSNEIEGAADLLPFFGWELSFPKNNNQGIRYEPWHWRFIGTPAIARALTSQKLGNSLYRSHGIINIEKYGQLSPSLHSVSAVASVEAVKDPCLYIAECLLELDNLVPEITRYNYRQIIMEKGSAFMQSLGISGTESQDALVLACEILTALLPTDRSARVLEMQRQMARLGIFQSTATGYYGSKTSEAVSQCHRWFLRSDSEFVDVEFLRLLRVRATTALQMIPPNRLAEIVRGEWIPPNPQISGLSYLANGRYVNCLSDGQLLVASCVTEGWDNTDNYVKSIDRPVTAALLVDTDHLPKSISMPILRVTKTRRAIGLLAQHARSLLQGKVIAITGSSGKTTTKEVLHHVLSAHGGTVSTPGSANSLMAICYQLLNWSIKADFYVCECGLGATGSSLDQQSHVLNPDIAIVTSVHAAHAEGYDSVEEIARKKVEIAKHLSTDGYLFLDGGSEYLKIMTEEARKWNIKHIFSFGYQPHCDIRVVNYEPQGLQGKALLEIFGIKYNLILHMPGRHWAQMAAIVVACCQVLGLDTQRVIADLEAARLPPGRGAVIGSPGESLVIIDSHYNANPGSMIADLTVLADIQLPSLVKKVGVIGSMKELGIFSNEGHRQIIPSIRAAGFSRLHLVGEEAKELIDALPDIATTAHLTVHEALDCLKQELGGNECVFVKGSHANDLAKITEFLIQRIDQTAKH
jgi:UDP-N-acetylmuramoyl-tripeptide--D-alanyl-D-alanine ligase